MSNSLNNSHPRVLLIFPPVWDTDAPFLSLPQLCSYLKQNNIDCKIIDANMAFWEFLVQEEFIIDFLSDANALLDESIRGEGNVMPFEQYLLLKELSAQPLEELITGYRENLVSRWKLRKAISFYWGRRLSEDLKADVRDGFYLGYHDQYFHQISLSAFTRSSKILMNLIDTARKTVFHSFFEKKILEEIIQLQPDIIGFSITAPNQVVPTFVFSRILKERLPKITIVCGGSWCTLLKDRIKTAERIHKYIDAYVFHEGEMPLLRIAQNFQDKNKWKDIPNVAFLFNNRIHDSEMPYSIDLDELPTPTFDDFSLHKYDLQNTLPLQASRGCNWGKCEFCSYSFLEPCYRYRNPILTVEDILTYKRVYGVSHICFADSLISNEVIDKWGDSLSDEIAGTTWQAFAKVSNELDYHRFKRLYGTGCRMLIWGIESGSNDVLRAIRKGATVKMAESNLADSTKAGIHNRVCMIYGFPFETKNDALKSISFLSKNIHNIQSLSFGRFALEKFTTMYFRYIEAGHGIVNSDEDLAIGYPVRTIMSEEELSYFSNKLYEYAVDIKSRQAYCTNRFELNINTF